MARANQKRTPRAHYYARGEGSSFNISNVIEDLIESVFAFALRYVYTTWLLISSPKAIAFHIFTRNRRLRITRPYTFFFFSYVLFMAGFSLSLVFGAEMAHLLNKYYGANFSFKEFVDSFSAERALLSFAPTVIIVLLCMWVTALVTGLVLVPWRRFRRLLAPVFFGLTFMASLHFLSLALASAAEVLADQVLHIRSERTIYTTGFEVPAFVLFLFSLLIGISLARLLFAFSRAASGRRKKLPTRIARTLAAWGVATTGLYGTVFLAGGIPWVMGDMSAKLDRETAETPQARLTCKSAEWVDSVFMARDQSPLLELRRSRPVPPFLHHEFEFLLVNQGEVQIELTSEVNLKGDVAHCSKSDGARSCDFSHQKDIGTARIIEPRPMGGYVIVPPQSALGMKVKVVELPSKYQYASFVSVPLFDLSVLLVDLRGKRRQVHPDNECDPFSAYLHRFRDNFL